MHIVNSLFSKEYDFAASTAPRLELMIATLPRAGSTYFCIELWKTGLLGAPLEYANFGLAKVMRERLSGIEDPVEYWRQVQRLRTGGNGVFSYKMFMNMYLDHGRQSPAMLKRFAPDKVVYLTRRDKVAQAISYSKAIKSKSWFAGTATRVQPEYDPAHVRMSERSIHRQERFWEKVFQLTETTVLPVVYEDFLENPDAVKARICDWTGQAIDPGKYLDIPNLSRQADETSAAWTRRYLQDRQP